MINLVNYQTCHVYVGDEDNRSLAEKQGKKLIITIVVGMAQCPLRNVFVV